MRSKTVDKKKKDFIYSAFGDYSFLDGHHLFFEGVDIMAVSMEVRRIYLAGYYITPFKFSKNAAFAIEMVYNGCKDIKRLYK